MASRAEPPAPSARAADYRRKAGVWRERAAAEANPVSRELDLKVAEGFERMAQALEGGPGLANPEQDR